MHLRDRRSSYGIGLEGGEKIPNRLAKFIFNRLPGNFPVERGKMILEHAEIVGQCLAHQIRPYR